MFLVSVVSSVFTTTSIQCVLDSPLSALDKIFSSQIPRSVCSGNVLDVGGQHAVQNLARVLAVMAEAFCWLPQSVQVDPMAVPRTGHDHLPKLVLTCSLFMNIFPFCLMLYLYNWNSDIK